MDLNGQWIINSIPPNKTKIMNIIQTGNNIKGNDNNYLVEGTGNIVYNKLIWIWNKDEDTKMIGDIILEDLSNKKTATQIKWQNGNSWRKILPATNIRGKWMGDGLVHGPIQIEQENNSISGIYPVYGGFTGTIINNEISINWVNNVSVKGIVEKDSSNNNIISWETGLIWKPEIKEKIKNIVKEVQEPNIKPKFYIPPPPLSIEKKKEKNIQTISSPLPTIINEN